MSRNHFTTPRRDNTTQELGGKFDAARRATGVPMARMRSSIRANLFAAPTEPVRLGRFVILERVGQGGMGIVYRAYDPKLDRRVALKLLRSTFGGISEQAKQRLLREARALARLSHPNVVPIHDVGLLDEQVFIVMGFVEGETLGQWTAAGNRSWRDIVEAYVQAARGLAAAHDVSLVHRDFKPDNVLVSDDGRIQVLDFGLARGRELDNDEPADARAQQSFDDAYAPVRDSLTATGAVVGTPAYMSPEQYTNQPVEAASDQFSFCISLYEALYGQRPFVGQDAEELEQAIVSGEISPPSGKPAVPKWLLPIIQRGLQRDPNDRYPSMNALIAALSTDPARTRRRWLVALALAASVGLSAYAFARNTDTERAVCQGAEHALARTWNPDKRATIARALSETEQRYAAIAGPRIVASVDAYADAWVTMHERACWAHHRGEQSGDLLDKRMTCLDSRLVALDSALSIVAETRETSLDSAVDVISGLPAISYCADRQALAAAVPLPQDPDKADRVRALFDRLVRVEALEKAGRYAEARESLRDLATAAEAIGYHPLTAQIALVNGRIIIASGKREDAIRPLQRAAVLGIEAGTFEVGMEAIARRVFVEGTWSQYKGDALGSLDIAQALMAHVPNPTFTHALLLNNVGVVHMARGERDRARTYFRRAADVRATSDDEHIELAIVDYNLGLVTDDPDDRQALTQKTADTFERMLGPEHARSLERRRIAAAYIRDPHVAKRSLTLTCERLTEYHPDAHNALARCLTPLGLAAIELGEYRLAATSLELAAEHYERGARPVRARFARGLGLMYTGKSGDRDTAWNVLSDGRARLPAAPDKWWEQKLAAEFDLARGLLLLSRESYADARIVLEQSLAVLVQVSERSHKSQLKRHIAENRVALATALWGPRDDSPDATVTATVTATMRARATALIAQAEAWYRNAGPGFDARLSQIAAWRQARQAPR